MLSMPAFAWDDENEGQLATWHPEIRPEDVDSIWQLPTVQMRNTRSRPGVLFLGIDRQSRLLVVVADPTGQADVWRPRTAHAAISKWQHEAYYGTLDDMENGDEHE
jgi:hypothetical protein